MERQVGKGDSPGKGLRLEWQVLCQPIADRQSDDWHELERSPLLRLANGEVRSRCAGGSLIRTRGRIWRRSSSWRQSRLPDALACQATRTLQPQGARSPMTEAVAVTPRWPRHEAREYQGELALRHLHPRLDRARPGARVQLARQPAGSIRGLHQEPAHEGWRLMRDRYDDGGFSGGSIDRPALKKLLDAVRARRVDVIVVYSTRLQSSATPQTASASLQSPAGACLRRSLPSQGPQLRSRRHERAQRLLAALAPMARCREPMLAGRRDHQHRHAAPRDLRIEA